MGAVRRRVGHSGMVDGGRPGFWSQVGVPISYDLLITLGIEYAPSAWGTPPAWPGTVGIRKKMAFPLPFLRSEDRVSSEAYDQ